MYAPWAFYTGIWALYNPKLPIWPLIGLPDLAGDQKQKAGFGLWLWPFGLWLMALALLIVVGWFQCHTLNHLPINDYRPYAIGVNIPQDMQSAAERGLTPPVYITMYELTNKESGEVLEMDSKTYVADRIWENKSLEITKSWGPIKVEEGYEPPIPPDFEFTNAEGDLMTDSIIYDKGYVFLHVAYDLDQL